MVAPHNNTTRHAACDIPQLHAQVHSASPTLLIRLHVSTPPRMTQPTSYSPMAHAGTQISMQVATEQHNHAVRCRSRCTCIQRSIHAQRTLSRTSDQHQPRVRQSPIVNHRQLTDTYCIALLKRREQWGHGDKTSGQHAAASGDDHCTSPQKCACVDMQPRTHF